METFRIQRSSLVQQSGDGDRGEEENGNENKDNEEGLRNWEGEREK